MSIRYEGAGARDIELTIADAGQEIGDDTVPDGQVALVFNYDEVFYVQGTLEELRNLHNRIYNAVSGAAGTGGVMSEREDAIRAALAAGDHAAFTRASKITPEGLTDEEWVYYQNMDPRHLPTEFREKVEAALGWKKDDVDDAREIAGQVLGAVKIAEKGHVPEDKLWRYRNLRRIATSLDALGNQVSGRGEHADANTLWAMAARYQRMANELRVDLPTEEERVHEEHDDRPQ